MSKKSRTPVLLILLLGAVTTLAGCVADQMGLLVGGGAGVMFLNNYVENWEHDPSDYRTPGVKPKTAPETVSTVSIWETGFIVNWTPVSGTVAYNVYLNRMLYYEAQFDTEAVFAGLTEGQTYSVEIAAVNTAGEGPLSSPIVVIPAAGTGNNVPQTTLTAPTGGETWSGNRNITWNASDQDGDALTITTEISSDSGSNWTTIASQEANDEIYTWDTTVVADGSTYRVRVSATDTVSLASDSSTSDFSISNGGASHAPVISLTVPDGSETWSGTQDITWAASDPDGDTLIVDIYYSMNSGGTWVLESAGSPNDGSYSFDTTLLSDGDAYRIRLVVSDGTLISEDSSSSDFTIDNLHGGGEGNASPVVMLTSPNGGETLSGTQDITWDASDTDQDTLTITIEFSVDGGENWSSVADSEVDDGSYSWDTTSVDDATTYRIRVTANDGQTTASDTSAADFTISNGGGGTGQLGDVVINELMWMGSSQNGHDEDDEWIELRNLTNDSVDISSWTIVNGGQAGIDLTIPNNTSISANGYFLIAHKSLFQSRISVEPNLVLDSLNLNNNGEQLILKDSEGTTIDTVWKDEAWPWADTAYVIEDTYRSLERMASPVDGTQQSDWKLCSGSSEELDPYWVWEADGSDPVHELGTPGGANSSVNQPPQITLLSPNGGETWSGEEEIRWTATDPDGVDSYVAIYISSDSGATWTFKANVDGSLSSYSWDTTSYPSIGDTTTYRVKVVVDDYHQNQGTDESEADFTIDNGQ